jgi:hypothetical protein
VEPQPEPQPEPEPEPEPEPGPDVVTFTADSAGGLVDPLLTGTAEPGALVDVTASDGRAWPVTAGETGEWSMIATDSPAGVTTYTAVQSDAEGNLSPASDPVVVELVPPTLVLSPALTPGGLVWRGEFHGAPGAVVEILVDGAVLGPLPLDDGGDAEAFFGWDEVSVDRVDVRYTADGRTGPAQAATGGIWPDLP